MTKRRTRKKAPPKPPHIVTEYAELVTRGEIVAGPHVRAQCRRHLDDLENGAERGIYFDEEKADRALNYFPLVLRLSDGQFEGRPFELHISQAFIVGSIFGWIKQDGTRRFRRAYIEQGKGNGKSPLAAGIGLYGMTADNEPGAQVYSAAAKMDQARILFNDAVAMVRQSERLEDAITPSGVNPVNNLAYLRKGSFFKPLGRDTGKTGSGLRPHFVLIDELHEHPNRDTLDMLERGFKARRQPLVLMITNSGSDLESVCYEEHEHAIAVAHQEVEDDDTFTFVCSLDEEDDPLTDPSCWPKANPLLGVILTQEYLEGVAKQAAQIPGKANAIKRLHFCIWTDAESAWINRETWEKCEDPNMTLDDFAEQEAFIGLDLGATKDLTAKAYVFEDGTKPMIDEESGEVIERQCYALFAHGYTPKETLAQREKDDKAPYRVWTEKGFLTATSGSVIRLDIVARDLVEDSQKFTIAAVSYDRWLIRDFEHDLDELGVTLPLVEHPQGWNRRKQSPLWMPGSVDEFETLLIEGRLRIQVNPALASAVAGATFAESAAGLKRFEKRKAKRRIDLCVAAAMAIGAATARDEDEPEKESYLSRRTGPIMIG